MAVWLDATGFDLPSTSKSTFPDPSSKSLDIQMCPGPECTDYYHWVGSCSSGLISNAPLFLEATPELHLLLLLTEARICIHVSLSQSWRQSTQEPFLDTGKAGSCFHIFQWWLLFGCLLLVTGWWGWGLRFVLVSYWLLLGRSLVLCCLKENNCTLILCCCQCVSSFLGLCMTIIWLAWCWGCMLRSFVAINLDLGPTTLGPTILAEHSVRVFCSLIMSLLTVVLCVVDKVVLSCVSAGWITTVSHQNVMTAACLR